MNALRLTNNLENAEFRVDSASKSNLNFAVVAHYKGSLSTETVQNGLLYLQCMHPLLQVAADTTTKVTHYIKATSTVPFRECRYSPTHQWKEVAKQDLAMRFSNQYEPLWRVTLLKGEGEGELVITFHHAIADGVSTAEIINHLFTIFSELQTTGKAEITEFNRPLPDLKSLYPLSAQEPAEEAPASPREDKGYHTNFLKDAIDEKTTEKMIQWTKAQGVKVNGTLFAAFLLAIRRVVDPDFDAFTAISIVNYRPWFQPAVSKQTLALLRTGIADDFVVQKNEDFSALAQAVHRSVHTQLESGKHVLNLKILEKRLERDISPEELWQRSRFPANAAIITNLGALDFSGKYGDLSLNEIFFVANVEPFIENPTNFILGTLTFQGKTFLSLWFMEELVEEQVGQSILLEMKKILMSL